MRHTGFSLQYITNTKLRGFNLEVPISRNIVKLIFVITVKSHKNGKMISTAR